ncbi:MAG: hypothetical protein LAO05_07385 [Acidobacteriia bacterium]|nr:hypothetical protein [Terriglobia bacterium]
MGRKSRNRLQRRQTPPVPPDEPAPVSDQTTGPQPGSRIAGLATALTAAVLLLVLVTVWATPRVSGDTFMSLAGGRDVLDGKLGKPDEWSFTTSGRVWPHQNWGFDALAYVSTRVAGERGLLVLKALLLLATASVMVAASRARGAEWPATLLVMAAALAGVRWHLELRANLATYLMAVLLVLIIYRSCSRPRLIWVAVPLMAAWANLHGGFMLGFAMLGLWTATCVLAAIRTEGLARATYGAWPPAVALAASVALAAILSPFGTTNLTHPLTIARDAEWRTIAEWQPVSLTATRGPATTWELLLLLALVAVAAGWRWLTERHGREGRIADRGAATRRTLFDAGLVIGLAAMAFSANRFVPLALIVLAPLAAFQVELLLRWRQSWILPAIGAVALTIPVAPFAGWVAARYGRNNPRFTEETFFQRMVGADRMPYGATEFLRDNEVAGRVFNDWRWEGFLRWRCPALQVFLGGRAQQIYTTEALHSYEKVPASPNPAGELSSWDTHLAVVPAEGEYLEFADRLVFTEAAHWAPVFYDGRSLVLAELRAPETRALVAKVADGTAPFRGEAVAALSRALCRVSPALGADGPQAVADLVAANRAFPTSGGPWFLAFTARERHLPSQWLARTLERDEALLAAASGGSEGRLARLQARVAVSQILANLNRASGHEPQAKQWTGAMQRLASELESLLEAS